MRDDFSAIGNMIRTHVDTEATSVSFEGFIDGIDNKLADFEPAPTAAREDIELVRAPESGSRVDHPSQGGFLGWLKSNLMPVTLGAMAAAALLLMVLRSTANTQDATNPSEAMAQSDVSTGDIVVDSVVNEGGKAVLVACQQKTKNRPLSGCSTKRKRPGSLKMGRIRSNVP